MAKARKTRGKTTDKPTGAQVGKAQRVRLVREVAAVEYLASARAHRAAVRGEMVSAADFKAHCLALMDEIASTGREIVITKRNRPVAKLVPVTPPTVSPFLGRAAGVVSVAGDIVAPTVPDWEEGADL